jgi:hypothetical protein
VTLRFENAPEGIDRLLARLRGAVTAAVAEGMALSDVLATVATCAASVAMSAGMSKLMFLASIGSTWDLLRAATEREAEVEKETLS